MVGNNPLSAEAFWRFSLAVYSRPEVAGALLRLQDDCGHNVNLVLFGLWLGVCAGYRLDAAVLALAHAAIAPLDGEIVQPLRRLRRQLRPAPDPDIQAMRQRLLSLELAAERRVQARLVASVRTTGAAVDRHAAVEGNLRLILGDDAAGAAAATLRAVLAPARPAPAPPTS